MEVRFVLCSLFQLTADTENLLQHENELNRGDDGGL